MGEAQGRQGRPSSLQAKVEPGSLERNAKVARWAVTDFDGPERMIVFGAIVSVTHSAAAGESSS